MTNSLESKTTQAFSWSMLESIIGFGFTFITGIIIARIVGPSEYGIIGIVTVIFSYSSLLIDSGFSSALVRDKDAAENDFNSIFIFNVFVSAALYIFLFVSAPSIASYFGQHQLTWIIRILGVTILIDSTTVVQKAILVKRIDFRTQYLATTISAVMSGCLGILLAFLGYGIWALVVQLFIKQLCVALVFWLKLRWRPNSSFSIGTVRKYFGYSSNLLLTGLITTTQNNIYVFIIGKLYPPNVLGTFTRAEQFNAIASGNVIGSIDKVTFPALASIQDDNERLRNALHKVNTTTFFASLLVVTVLFTTARPTILILLGEKWEESILYLQLICLSTFFLPLNSLNINILKIKGKSSVILRLQILKVFLVAVNIVTAVYFGIMAMLISRFFTTFLATLLNASYSERLVSYSVWDQVKDISPLLLAVLPTAVLMYLAILLKLNPYSTLAIQLLIGCTSFLVVNQALKLPVYLQLRSKVTSILFRLLSIKL